MEVIYNKYKSLLSQSYSLSSLSNKETLPRFSYSCSEISVFNERLYEAKDHLESLVNQTASSDASLGSSDKDTILQHSGLNAFNEYELKIMFASVLLQVSADLGLSEQSSAQKMEVIEKKYNLLLNEDFESLKLQFGLKDLITSYGTVDYERLAIKILKSVANANVCAWISFNNAETQFFLGKAYSLGLYGLNAKPQKAFNYFIKASKQNHPDAAYEVGKAYERGWAVKPNGMRALSFYKKAAILMHPLAMYKLGHALLFGEMGTKVNVKEAVMWLKRTTASISPTVLPEAWYDLGLCYLKKLKPYPFSDKNKGAVIQDDRYAFKLFCIAAENSHSLSQFQLGHFYQEGLTGLARSYEKAAYYYKLAANNDTSPSIEAQYALGSLYLNGHASEAGYSREQNIENGLSHVKKAALSNKLGPFADYAIGHMFHTGSALSASGSGFGRNIVSANLVEAKKWYKRAAARGHDEAKAKLKLVKSLKAKT